MPRPGCPVDLGVVQGRVLRAQALLLLRDEVHVVRQRVRLVLHALAQDL